MHAVIRFITSRPHLLVHKNKIHRVSVFSSVTQSPNSSPLLSLIILLIFYHSFSLILLLTLYSVPVEQHGVGQPQSKQIQVKHTGESVTYVIAALSILFSHIHSFVFSPSPLFAHALLSSLTLSFHFSLSFVLL
jgi:hypothetical protein